jgi:FlaA1/EpsC-like NDP-sugar epimerase
MVGDVRDLARLTRACSGCDAVVHAAALKRIETGAYNPDEMVKTNVLGTMNVIEAAVAAKVRYVVGLSSDKAYQPISPYGQSKALAESLMLAANHMQGKTKFSCTRYGNIWGAQGSVVPRWLALAEQGKNITVTDPDCTRFFMTIDEAVQMVWGLLCIMLGGELVIPDWLPAYQVGALALVICERYNVAMNITGLPEFEKLHESMDDQLCSSDARRMTLGELKELLQ